MNTKIACVQMDVSIGNVETNRQTIVDRIRTAAESRAQLVIFPECALTGYCFESLEEAIPFAEPLNGPSATAFVEACKATDTHAVVGFIEKDGSKFYNAAMLVGHNPGMEELLLLLTAESVGIATGTCAKVAVKASKWANAVDKRATLEWVVKPRELE